jgi:hypothetical protein
MNRREAMAALMGLPMVARIEVADVGPQDVIVIEAPGHLSETSVKRIKEYAGMIWPDRRVAVLGDGLKMKVLKGTT